jgi:flavin-dependent dehydrogenase
MSFKMQNLPTLGHHALVMGGSLAGLLAARVLANHFQQVTIIERDRFPDTPVPRKGVPQSRHVHLLLMKGQLLLEQLFPGLLNQLVAEGALNLDTMADMKLLLPNGSPAKCQSNLTQLVFSRDLLDWQIRKRLTEMSNIQFLDGQTVTGFIPNAERSGVAGVKVRSHHGSDQAQSETAIAADLVVDASGQSSKTPDWLAELGYPRPEETVVDAGVGYASRLYQRPKSFTADWQALWVPLMPPHFTSGAVLFPIEGDRWLVTLAGGDRDYPPMDEAGFLAFAQALHSPQIYDAIRTAEPLTPVYSYRKNPNRLRHYAQLHPYPENLVVTGHAVCQFNPVYGQGMTVAALYAQTLDQGLSHARQKQSLSLKGLAHQLQKRFDRVHHDPWLLATGQDCRYQSTQQIKMGLVPQLMQQYVEQVMQLTVEDSQVYRELLAVLHMVKPPYALFQPHIIGQVVKHSVMARLHHEVQPVG